ncbi:carbohydrate sulfotransferase 11-like [Macrobrachium nipponense]|uniref:carbohydrate sulfotransferase 11-like n=1 Tax=Macrobrachium nipponense TaxID=159736 RepID=UPI0030C80FE6
MMCKLRAVMWALAGLTLCTCIASVRWFLLSDRLAAEQRIPLSTPTAESRSWSRTNQEMKRRKAIVDHFCHDSFWQGAAANGIPGSGIPTAGEDPITEELVNNLSMLNNLIVDDKNHMLYCYVPKVACTNWKRMMLILTGATNLTQPLSIPADSVHRKNVFTKLSDLEPDGIRHRLQTYRKFLFVRHPIERVVSAFRNKFEKNYTSSAYFKKRFGVKIIKKYRQGIEPDDVPETGDGVKFSEFISYLIDTKSEYLNEHWAPVSNMCHPCLVRFQIIGKYETLADDAEYILRLVGAPPTIHFPEVIPSKTTALVESYVDTLTPRQKQGLIRIYENDFRIFNYNFRNLI